MSRLPPLPPGMPPRPRSSGLPPPPGDSYRPVAPQHENRFTQRDYYDRDRDHDRDRPPMYQFSASNGYDYSRRSPPRYDSYAPGTAPPHVRPSGSAYRPQDGGNGGGFTFRYDAPPAISSSQIDTYRPSRPRSPPRRNYKEGSNGYRQNHHQNQSRGGYRGRGAPRLASDREFLKGNREPTPELMPGMDEEASGVRYKAIEDVSDSEEAEMDMSDDDISDAQQPKKKARTGTKAADGESVPKWSNPDPYTALPPPDESQRKKKDVVKLIRKARLEASSGSTSKLEVADDFISLDFGDEADFEEEGEEEEQSGMGVVGAPTGPRFSHRSHLQGQEISSTQVSDGKTRETLGIRNIAPSKPAQLESTSDPALGSRKRDIRDEIKPAPILHSISKGKPSKQKPNGTVSKEWKATSGTTGTPWLKIDHSDTVNMGLWLHKEIVDFYHFVKPRDFESVIRSKLVEELREKVKRAFTGTQIYTFGSFPAGLYLPTADMDLVCVSDVYMSGGHGRMGQSNSSIRRFGQFIQQEGLAMDGSIDTILHAKVPLVKYTDKLTGLRVDISFENNTGLIANRTFLDWKNQFPAMPILVTLIKHLLAMRGLNEPVNGGIGGFSVTCLVVSLLQNMPQVQSRSMIAEHHLGEILMEFFDLYGNQFNTTTTAIQFDPPGYVSKAMTSCVYKANNQDRLSIIDPNNYTNDVSGGSGNTQTILKCFSNCYRDLQKRMGELQFSTPKDRRNQSILGCIVGGNYNSFKLQREHLAHIHEIRHGPVEAI